MKNSLVILAFLGALNICSAQQKLLKNKPGEVETSSVVQSKNYYLLTLLQQVNEVNMLLAQDAELKALKEKHQKAINDAMRSCTSVACFVQSMKFTDDEIGAVGKKLAKYYETKNAAVRSLAEKLISSYKYSLLKSDDKAAFLAKAWEQDAKGINYVLDVYLAGHKPNYPKIDSISFDTQNKSYVNLLYDFTVVAADETKNAHLFFEPALTCALHALEINERNDAANNEPMEEGENKPAISAIKNTDWKRYPYTLIMVPGAGPDEPGVALSAEGMLRCRLAALRYREGLAPFVMVSGGKVHPYKTPFIEALEMKKYMIKTLHLPEKAIIIEPHARHTTTNMRNAARLIYKYNIPDEKPAVVSTTKLQSDGIQKMAARCTKELGYVPYRLGKLVNGNVLEFYPLKSAQQIDADEPLDP